MNFYGVHGWGCDAALWHSLENLLLGQWTKANCGFFGTLYIPNFLKEQVLITHSMGLPFILTQIEIMPQAIIAVNGFPVFSRKTDFQDGIPNTVLRAMKYKTQNAVYEQLADFYHAAGVGQIGDFIEWTHEPSVSDLADGLDFLMKCDVREKLQAMSCPKLVLYSLDDAITPSALIEQAWRDIPNTTLIASQDGGHFLPLTKPEWCVDQIRQWRQSVFID